MHGLKISIIVACRDSQDTISKTIESIASQDYPKIELIIIDGCSTDDTLLCLDKFRNLIDVLVSEPDDGIFDAFNKGIALASGDVIGFLNSDDFFIQTDFISHVASCFTKNESIDYVYGDVLHVTSNSNVVRYYFSFLIKRGWIEWGLIPAHPSFYCRRAVYEQAGVYNTSLQIAGDFDFFARLENIGASIGLKMPGCSIAMRIGGMSNKSLSSRILTHREVVASLKANGYKVSGWKLKARYLIKLGEIVFGSVFIRKKCASIGRQAEST